MSHDVSPTSLANIGHGAPPGNSNRLRHGVYATVGDHLTDREHELAELILAEVHIADTDVPAVASAARLMAKVEVMSDDLNERGLAHRNGKARSMVDLYLRAERRLQEALDGLGMTPRARAAFVRDLTQAGSLAEDIRRRQEERERDRSSDPA